MIAYIVTKRICLGLQRKDAEMLLHGYETGIIYQRPSGEYIEVHAPVPEEKRAVLEAPRADELALEAGHRATTARSPTRPPGARSASCGWGCGGS